jgi:predicted amidohydrolase
MRVRQTGPFPFALSAVTAVFGILAGIGIPAFADQPALDTECASTVASISAPQGGGAHAAKSMPSRDTDIPVRPGDPPGLSFAAIGQETKNMGRASMEKNLVPNPSFEQVEGDLPVAWAPKSARPEIAPAVASSTGRARSGSRSLVMSGDGRHGVAGQAVARCAAITPGRDYLATAYVQAENVANIYEFAWAMVIWRGDSDSRMPRAAYLDSIERDGEWWRLSTRVRAPEWAAQVELTLGCALKPDGRVWWEDVSLQEVPAVPPRRVRLATAYVPQEHRTPEGWRRVIEQAGEGKADAVCLGELAEIVPPDRGARPGIPGPATEVLAELARRYHMLIIVSLPEWVGEFRYNTAVIIGRDGSIVGRYRKTHLPLGELVSGTEAGDAFPVFDTDIGRVGLQICYDHMYPEVTRLLALGGAEIVFTPVMGDGRYENQAHEAVARARAIDNAVFYVTSMRDVPSSLIVDTTGRVLADTKGVPGVAFADINLDEQHYQPWMSVAGEGDFRNIWRRERHPSLYRGFLQGQEELSAQAPSR